ncbi:MAG: hypothetical protein AAF202_01705, partial [Pseudomonadota bacterium]
MYRGLKLSGIFLCSFCLAQLAGASAEFGPGSSNFSTDNNGSARESYERAVRESPSSFSRETTGFSDVDRANDRPSSSSTSSSSGNRNSDSDKGDRDHGGGNTSANATSTGANLDPRGESQIYTPQSEVNSYSPNYENTVTTDELAAHLNARKEAILGAHAANPISAGEETQVMRSEYYSRVSDFYNGDVRGPASTIGENLSQGPAEAHLRRNNVEVSPALEGSVRAIDQTVRDGYRAYMPGDLHHPEYAEPLENFTSPDPEVQTLVDAVKKSLLDSTVVVAPKDYLEENFGLRKLAAGHSAHLKSPVTSNLAVVSADFDDNNEPVWEDHTIQTLVEEVVHGFRTIVADEPITSAQFDVARAIVRQRTSVSSDGERVRTRVGDLDIGLNNLPESYTDSEPGPFGFHYSDNIEEVQTKISVDTIIDQVYGQKNGTATVLGNSIYQDLRPQGIGYLEAQAIAKELSENPVLREKRNVINKAVSTHIRITDY